MNYVTAKKLKMGQIFQEDRVVPVTFLSLNESPESDFEIGQKLKITGISKGRGFQGVVKRHGFRGDNRTHGTKHTLRAPGSIGSTGPQRVMPGLKMAGRMGQDSVTVKNLEVVGYERDRNLLILKGAIPGNKGGNIKVFV